jgi:hypothetical protein
MIPEWMEDDSSDEQQISLKDNGVWTNNELSIPNLVSEFMRVWLEDNVPNTLMEGVKKSKGQYTEDKQVENIKRVYGNLIANRRSEFEALIDITKEKEKENKDEK